jgi:hypothetical protein
MVTTIETNVQRIRQDIRLTSVVPILSES